jgi:hypothetical protein
MAKVKAPSGGKKGGTGGTPKQVAAAVNKQVKNAGLSKAESNYISSLISQAAKTGKGISAKEKQVILNEAKKQASDKNAGVSAAKRADPRAVLVKGKANLPSVPNSPTPTGTPIFQGGPQVSSQTSSPISAIKSPDQDVIQLAGQSVDSATIQALLFENIGANELTKFVRHDTVEGINQYYGIISNLSDIKRRYNPTDLISLQKADAAFFDTFAINLEDKVPDETYLNQNNLKDYLYIDTNGDLIIEVVNMADSEIVEVQIDTNGTIYTIREQIENLELGDPE